MASSVPSPPQEWLGLAEVSGKTQTGRQSSVAVACGFALVVFGGNAFALPVVAFAAVGSCCCSCCWLLLLLFCFVAVSVVIAANDAVVIAFNDAVVIAFAVSVLAETVAVVIAVDDIDVVRTAASSAVTIAATIADDVVTTGFADLDSLQNMNVICAVMVFL